MASMSSKEKASHTQSPSLSKQLSTLPTRNAKQFVSSYVGSQHSFLKLHISQGRAEVGSWAKSDLQSDLHAGLPCRRQEPLEVLGFGTPVLEPRKRAPSCDSRDVDGKYGQKQRESAKPITNKEKNNGLPANSITPEHEKVKVNKQAPRSDASPARKTAKSKTTGKEQKRTLQEEAGSDGERRERQEERKKRRRIKKDIMAPAYNEDANIKEGIKKDRKRSVKAKAVKPHAAFALMHGFTTTSVGKNRLTLEPRSVGVFKKGKASESLAVSCPPKPRKNARDICFSEAQFLQKKKRTKILPENASTSSSLTVHMMGSRSEQEGTSAKRKRVEATQHSGISGQTSDQIPVVKRRSRSPYNPNDSVVWDIEKNSALQLSSDSVSDRRQGIILVKFPPRLNEATENAENNQMSRTIRRPSTSGSMAPTSPSDRNSCLSLGPSQSASQVGPRALAATERGLTLATTSVYFKPVDDKSRNQNPSWTTVEETQRPVIEEDQAPTGVSKPLLDCNPVALNIGIQDGPVLDSGYIITLAGERLLPGDVDSLSDEVLPALLDYTLSESNYSLSSCFWLPDHRDPGIVSSKVDDFTGMDPGFTASVDFDIHWTGEPGGDSEGSVDWSDVCDNMSIMDPAFLVHGTAISEQVLEQLPVQDSLTDDDEAGLSFGEFPCSQDVLLPTFDQDERNSVGSTQTLTDVGIHPPGFLGDSKPESGLGSDADSGDQMDNFFQGRTLLHGFDSWREGPCVPGVHGAEAEVAGLLKRGHWLPQRL